ncbi:hypothetical protein PFISCL1PPCAC_22523, partial [Pristionchus fissidentatus]
AGDNYTVENFGLENPKFVLYAVDLISDNINTPVYTLQQEKGITAKDRGRFFTVLSSFDAVQYYDWSGTFPVSLGYPKIYTMGFDSVSDAQCRPVYEARSQYQAEQSWPSIYAPIITVDFGFDGTHAVSAHQQSGASCRKNGAASTLYMSPG